MVTEPSPLAGNAPGPTSVPPRFKRYEIADDGCWNWTGDRNKKSYGRFQHRGREVKAHRAFFEHFIGPIPEGFTVHHRCHNPSCVNPEHLEALTASEHAKLHRPAYECCPHCEQPWAETPWGNRCWRCDYRRRMAAA